MLDAATRPRLVRGLTLGLGGATVLIGAWLVLCPTRAPEDSPAAASSMVEAQSEAQAEAQIETDAEAPTPSADADAGAPTPSADAQPAPLPSDCPALADRAREGGPDAVLLAWLCPQSPLDAVAARAALLAVRSPDEAAALLPRLTDHPDLRGLASLVAQTAVHPPATILPDPAQAVVSPIDAQVLAQVQRAHTLVATPGLAPGERTRARALLAKVYLQATQQLGVGVGRPTEPFARLLAGRALHYGRLFCLSYWRMRVRGLAGLFAEVETGLLALVLALEGSAHHGDAARLTVELHETRGYLQREGPRTRIERHLAESRGTPWGPERLRPEVDEIDRLLEHGLVDLALARALALARLPQGPGLLAMEQLVRDGLARAERSEYTALLERRFEQARERTPAPDEPGPESIEHASEPSWPRAEAVADQAAHFIEQAPAEPGLARRYALGRALLLVRSRPDALIVLLDRATDPAASPPLRGATAWLAQELAARDDGRLAWQARRVAAETDPDPGVARSPAMRHAQEAARRRRFALRIRQDERMPRGPGM